MRQTSGVTLFSSQDDQFEQALPPGLILIQDWLTLDESNALLAAIDAEPWLDDLNRRVQQYGWKYDYTLRDLSPDQYLGPIPDVFGHVVDRLAHVPEFGVAAEQLIVNEYCPGQGIAPHVDRLAFGDVVASVSLGDQWPMEFRSPRAQTIEVFLPIGGLLLMTEESRFDWSHSIRPRKSDRIDGRRVPRARRVSVTFRTISDEFRREITSRRS